MSIDQYRVQEFDHVIVNGVEYAVEFDHDDHVIRASRSATLSEVVRQVAMVATKRERRRRHRRGLVQRLPIPVVGKVSGVLWLFAACVA